MSRPMLWLGEPPFDDVEAAAQLLVRYRREGGLSDEGKHVFLRMIEDPNAVRARANEIEAEPSAAQ